MSKKIVFLILSIVLHKKTNLILNILYIKYNKDNKILVVTKSNIENTYRYIQKYKLNIKNWKIVYEIYGDVIEERTFN